jgi:PAS domain S-box-containing protein
MWCEGSAQNLLNDPLVQGILINYRDVTATVEAEKKLRASEKKFRYLMQNGSDAILVIDEAGIITFASDSAFRLLGYERNELLYYHALKYVVEEDKDLLRAKNEKLITSPHESPTVQYRLLKKDGSVIWCEAVVTNLLNIPEVNGLVVNFRDVTESKLAEEKLKNSEYLLRSLIANSSDIITITDETFKFSFASDSLEKVTGYTRQEINSFEGFDLVHPDEHKAFYDFLDWLKQHPGEADSITFRLRKKDGSWIWLERISINLMHDPAIKGIISNYRDITERKRRTDELTRTNDELMKTNVELDKFVYSVSHDLRAPLASLLGLVEYSETLANNQEIQQYLQYMKASVIKLDTFIQDILDYSRNARSEVETEVLDVNALLSDISSNLKFMNTVQGSRLVDIRTRVLGDAVFHTDKDRLKTILGNLVANAIRYSNHEAKTPYVEVNVEFTHTRVKITVQDNGIGINQKHLPKIFDMFYRASSLSVGSGLGLYIVKESVQKLGGIIEVESTPGVGTKFTISIPDLVT